MSQEKTPTWIRILEIILGAIAIAASGIVLTNPDTTTVMIVMLLSISLLVVGISSIITGAVGSNLSKSLRGIKIGMGIVAIIGSIFSIVNPVAAALAFVNLIAIFVLIYGAGLVAEGIGRKEQSKASKIASIVIGVIVVILSAILLALPGFTLALLIMILSISLLLNGIARIISGITGRQIRPIQQN